ncbi:hypothetical protein FCG40_01355 [Fimbriimonadia bacterium ATM]|nr:MAG: hypothetical protein EDM73_10150 [Armatimonadota bacterium]MBC6970284.1 hypothetical protein [Armatimonadota bacterium]MCE7899536.1 hypothetical protein [Armatimonadetes bacterium ATM1]MDL1927624.1 hypothetical protein [Fimbriimonadia bacterium ATM]RIJ96447.1 MAG: hypothetical protein DCC45_07250 [Armatimonadota bacterium]
MDLHVNLSKETQARLRARAEELGLKVEEYAAELLERSARMPARTITGAEAVAVWKREGVIGSRGDITDSVAHARRLRRKAERRRA